MPETPVKKRFKMFDAVLASVCVVMTIEASAPAAKMGNSQFFWWAVLILTFFLPYGLVTAELGTAYPGQGGIYEWVKKAYGTRMGSRVASYYWLNFPVWVSSIVVLFTDLITSTFHLSFGKPLTLAIQLLLIWLVSFLSCFPISDSKWVLNVAATFKALIMLALGGLGFYAAIVHGTANPFTLRSFIPSFSSGNLSYVFVVLFDLVGFEVITTYTGDMEQPGKQLPRAIKLGGIFISFFYILTAFGISVAIPTGKISASTGIVESFQMMLHTADNPLIDAVAVMFLYSLFANLISWSLGVNYVLRSAAQDRCLPKFMARSDKRDMPVGATIVNGIISSAIVVLGMVIPNPDVFWQFFAMNMIILLMSYVMIFPSFLRLRKLDPGRSRPFRVKGGRVRLTVYAVLPMLLIIFSLIFSIVPFNLSHEELSTKIPLIVGTVLVLIISEIIAYRSCRAEKTHGDGAKVKNLAPEPKNRRSKMSRIVIALGGNALGNGAEEQQRMIDNAAPSLIGLIKQGHEIIVSHGNGPQVGMINLAFSVASREDGKVSAMELPECSAMSQGYIGYHLQKGIKKELTRVGMPWHVATVITQVEVDPNDPAFKNPHKPIGAFYDKATVEQLSKEHPDFAYVEDSGRGYRRVVASPTPVDIVEKDSILNLLDHEFIVIACGGGGIPVVKDGEGVYHGVPAVIDKDFSSAKLADAVGAQYLFILTAVDKVAVNFGRPDQRNLDDITVEQAEQYCEEGQFAAGSMLPKVRAAIEFAKGGNGRRAVIASLEKAPLAMQGLTGTVIHA